ncbi:MAG: enoyl-CoA hydratase [Hyphomicrobiales bacterium]
MNRPVNPSELDDSDILLRDDSDGIVTLTLNRPKARNSLSEELLAALQNALDGIAGDDTVRAVIIASTGPAFCAGHDLKQMTARRSDPDRGRAYFQLLLGQCSTLMQSIVRCPKPVIAQVHAIASAAGCQLVASCDLAVAGESAGFCTPGVHIGLFCSTPMVPLSRNVSRKHAMEMLLTGDTVSAERAAGFGLVNRVVPDADLAGETRAIAKQIASKSAHTIKIGKEAFYRQLEMDLAGAYDYASQVMTENMLARDAEEGIGAFIDKRDPEWEDR